MCSMADDVDAVADRRRATSRSAASRSRRDERERRAAVANGTNARHDRRPRRQHAQRHLGDDAERAFRADEEIDQVHVRRGEVAGRQLRHAAASDSAGTGTRTVRSRSIDLEVAVRVRARRAALDVEHVAARQHDGERLDPVARRAVLERRGARGVGGDDAADERAGERGRRRIVAGRRCSSACVEVGERDAGLHAHPVGRRSVEMRLSRDVLSTTLAHRRRAAGQRRLRADRQQTVAAPPAARRLPPPMSAIATPSAWPPGKCAASSRNDATTSGSRDHRAAPAHSPRGAARRMIWPAMALY